MPGKQGGGGRLKPPQPQAGRGNRRRESETGSHSALDFGDDFGGGRVLKPDDQLQLTEQELKEEFTRILTANNPHAPQNIVRYNFKERQFRPIPQVDQLAVHFFMDGNLIHKESDEAKRQTEARAGLDTEPEAEEETTGGEADQEEAEDGETPLPKPAAGKKLTNQFNFCERATQTYNNPHRERENQTEPPPRSTFSQTANQWIIYDEYKADFEKNQDKSKDKKGVAAAGKQGEEKRRKKLTVMDSQADDLAKINHAVQLLDRMVNQNTFDEIAQDFKYWEDPSDEFRDQQGTLLPLWKFGYDKARKLAVTAITWSPKYHDFFAVAYGSYDFMKQTRGLVCFYTLKNPTHPEFVFETDSAVLSVALHPDYPHMICAGMYNGSVAVYSAVQNKKTPLYQCTARNGKHTDPVWQVCWAKDDIDSNMNFYSTSSDGRVTCWTLVKEGVGAHHHSANDLLHQDIIRLELEGGPSEGPDGIKLENLGAGTTFDFHKEASHLFLVGSEEGKVFKCSTAYSKQFLQTFDAHHMAVYKVTWNPFHSSIFMTCSADWTVKIWDHSKTEPVFVFDLNSPVGDVAWAPYSSTVFAAVTADGRVHVFDLQVNKYEALCEQVVAQKKKTKLTHVAFNPLHPILLVGDDRGHVTSLKLSPNLRKLPKEKKGAPQPGPEAQVEKLDKILTMVG